MKNKNKCIRDIRTLTSAALIMMTMGINISPANANDYVNACNADSLYIGDYLGNSVICFDSNSGAYQADFIPPGSLNGRLQGVTGLIFTQGVLDVVNQNANVGNNTPGEVLQFQSDTGDFKDALVPALITVKHQEVNNHDAPFVPRGLIRGPNNILYVADNGDNYEGFPGNVWTYNATNGKWLGNFVSPGSTDLPGVAPDGFNPRGIVLGPDGLIYVSLSGDVNGSPTVPPDEISGSILRFTLNGKFVDVFTSNNDKGCAANLHRPEGLVFGPDGNLYVTSFEDPSVSTDTDKILIYNGKTGKCIDHIDLDVPGALALNERAYAHGLLFGPQGRLFVPITGGAGIYVGEVRRYNVETKNYDVLVPPTSPTTTPLSSPSYNPMQAPFFLTFGKTNPSTLEYDNEAIGPMPWGNQ
jgi:hypothetical protein